MGARRMRRHNLAPPQQFTAELRTEKFTSRPAQQKCETTWWIQPMPALARNVRRNIKAQSAAKRQRAPRVPKHRDTEWMHREAQSCTFAW